MLNFDYDTLLIERYRQGDDDAGKKLVEKYTPFINRACSSILPKIPANLNYQAEDVQAELRFAILKAAKAFDSSRNVKFITYLTWAVKSFVHTKFFVELHRQKTVLNNLTYSEGVLSAMYGQNKDSDGSEGYDVLENHADTTQLELSFKFLLEKMLPFFNKTEIYYIMCKIENKTCSEICETLGVTPERLAVIRKNISSKQKQFADALE